MVLKGFPNVSRIGSTSYCRRETHRSAVRIYCMVEARSVNVKYTKQQQLSYFVILDLGYIGFKYDILVIVFPGALE